MSTGCSMPNKPGKRSKPKPSSPVSQRDDIVAVRCKTTWKGWLQRFASKERSTPTTLIDRALADYAAKLGFEEPPER